MNVLVIVQARTGSTRLPGKILLPLAGKPLLERLVERIRAATVSFELVIATTTGPDDDPVRVLCREIDVPCFRGHPTDLLSRHFHASLMAKADWVVKIPSDCPLIDPAVIDRVLTFAVNHAGDYDVVSNLHPPTWPDGNDVEAMSMEALTTAWREARESAEREHTTPFLWSRPDRFRIGNVQWETGLDYSLSHRWTIDYEEDYHFVRAVFDALYTPAGPVFGVNDILALLDREPSIAGLNARHAGKAWYNGSIYDPRGVPA